MITPRTRYSERGNAILELALVLPVIAAIALGGLEYSRALKWMQISATLSRESASIAYRDCSMMRDDANILGPQYLTICLQRVRSTVAQQVQESAPNAMIILSLYDFDGVIEQEALVGGNATFSSKYDPVSMNNDINGHLSQTVVENDFIVISEVYLPYKPIVPGLAEFIFLSESGAFYDATII